MLYPLFVFSELTHFIKVAADRVHAADLEIILVIPAMKRGLVSLYVYMYE